ncbi:MAG: PspC domain-containing protein [bacterium]|nr:PspC domain-containing protein [bacterium]
MEQLAEHTRSGANSRTLERHPSDRWVGGIAAGLAERWGIDPALVRVIVLLASLVSGLGLIAYGLGWLFLRDSRTGTSAARDLLQGRPSAAVPLGAALVLVGLIRPLYWGTPLPWHSPYHSGGGNVFALVTGWLALLLIGAVIAAVVLSRRSARRSFPDDAAHVPYTGSPSAGGAGGGAEFAGDGGAGAWEGPGGAADWAGPGAGSGSGAGAGAGAGVPYPTGGAPADPELAARAAAARLPRVREPRVRAPGPGRRISAGIGALALLGVAVVLVLHAERITLATVLLAAGVALAALALGVLISGVRGRRGGWMTGLTVLLAPLVMVAVALVPMLPRAVLLDLPLNASGGAAAPGEPIRIAVGDMSFSNAGDAEVVMGFGYLSLSIDPEDAVRIELDPGVVDVSAWDFTGWKVEVNGQLYDPPDWTRMHADEGVAFYRQYREPVAFVSPSAAADGPDSTVRATLGVGTLSMYTRGEN